MVENRRVARNVKMRIVSSALLGFGGVLSETSMNVAFPKITRVFHMGLTQISWITTVYLLGVAITMTLSSYLKKNFTYRMLFITSTLVFTVGTLLGGLAPSFFILLIGRILQGIGTGLAIPLTFNLVLDTIPVGKVGSWMGFASMIMSLAPSIGPTYGGLLVDTLGWRMIFYTILVVPVLSFCLGYTAFHPQQNLQRKHNLDVCAFLFLSVSLTLLLIFVTTLESGKTHKGLLLGLLLTTMAFVWRSLTSDREFLNIKLFAIPHFVIAVVPFFLYPFANIGGNFLIPSYLQIGFGATSFVAGAALFPGTLAAVILNPFFGKFYDKHGEKIPLILGNSLVFIALTLMFFTTNTMNVSGMVILYSFFSLGRVMAFSILNTSTLATLKNKDQADGTAILQTTQQFAGAIGTAVVSLLSSSASTIKLGMNHTVRLFLLFNLFSFFMFFLLFKLKENKK